MLIFKIREFKCPYFGVVSSAKFFSILLQLQKKYVSKNKKNKKNTLCPKKSFLVTNQMKTFLVTLLIKTVQQQQRLASFGAPSLCSCLFFCQLEWYLYINVKEQKLLKIYFDNLLEYSLS